MTPRSVYFLLLALPLSARGASDPVSPEQGAVTPADIADFKQTAARFAERELDFRNRPYLQGFRETLEMERSAGHPLRGE